MTDTCLSSCQSDSDCSVGLTCVYRYDSNPDLSGRRCRNSICQSESDCLCFWQTPPSPTQAPISTPIPSDTPTSVPISPSGSCSLAYSQTSGVGRDSLGSWKQTTFAVPSDSILGQVSIEAGSSNVSISRVIICQILDQSALISSPISANISSRSWVKFDFSSQNLSLTANHSYTLQCRNQDSWNSCYWTFDWSKGKTIKVETCQPDTSLSIRPATGSFSDYRHSPPSDPIQASFESKIGIDHGFDFSPSLLYQSSLYGLEFNLDQKIAKTPSDWVRLGLYFTWEQMEPEQGSWDHQKLTELDTYLNSYRQNNKNILLNICCGAKWWPDPGQEGFPNTTNENIAQFANYARKMAQAANGRVKYYEIWNEPNVGGFWNRWFESVDGSFYVKLVQAASQAIKQVQPDAKIILGGTDGYETWAWVDNVLENNILDYIDVWAVHPYRRPSRISSYISDLNVLKNKIKPYQAGRPLEFWATEMAFPSVGVDPWPNDENGDRTYSEPIDEVIQSYLLAQTILLSLDNNFDKFFWWNFQDIPASGYCFSNPASCKMGLIRTYFKIETDSNPELVNKIGTYKSSYFVYKTINQLLKNSRPIPLTISDPQSYNLDIHAYSAGDKIYLALWKKKPDQANITTNLSIPGNYRSLTKISAWDGSRTTPQYHQQNGFLHLSDQTIFSMPTLFELELN